MNEYLGQIFYLVKLNQGLVRTIITSDSDQLDDAWFLSSTCLVLSVPGAI